MIRRFHPVVGLMGGVLMGCGDPSLCFEPYEPSGLYAESSCDCTDGILYLCSNAETCSGEVGRTSCEFAALEYSLNVGRDCPECEVRFTDAGAVFMECGSGGADSVPGE